MSDEYDDTTAVESYTSDDGNVTYEFHDEPSLTSDQWFGTPPALSDQEALAAAVSEPFDYAAEENRGITALDVTQARAEAREELAQMPAAPADDEWLDAGDEWPEEQQQTEQEYTAAQAIADHTGASLDQVYRWFAMHPDQIDQAVAEVRGLYESETQLNAYAEATRAATEAGNRPALERAEELLQGQQIDAAAEGMFADFVAAGVRPENLEHAHQLADALFDHAVTEMGLPVTAELAQECVDTVAERVAMEDRGIFFPDDGRSPRPAKLTEADFNRRWGGHLPVGQGRPSVTSLFFGGE